MSNTPSDAELSAFADAFDWDGWIAPALAKRAFARAVLAKWGTPQPVVREPLSDEREAFEAWYCKQMVEAGYGSDCTIRQLREENHYGEHRVMLNGKWEGWQARAALAAQQQ